MNIKKYLPGPVELQQIASFQGTGAGQTLTRIHNEIIKEKIRNLLDLDTSNLSLSDVAARIGEIKGLETFNEILNQATVITERA